MGTMHGRERKTVVESDERGLDFFSDSIYRASRSPSVGRKSSGDQAPKLRPPGFGCSKPTFHTVNNSSPSRCHLFPRHVTSP